MPVESESFKDGVQPSTKAEGSNKKTNANPKKDSIVVEVEADSEDSELRELQEINEKEKGKNKMNGSAGAANNQEAVKRQEGPSTRKSSAQSGAFIRFSFLNMSLDNLLHFSLIWIQLLPSELLANL